MMKNKYKNMGVQCYQCINCDYIFQGITQKERNEMARIIQYMVRKYGCNEFVRKEY